MASNSNFPNVYHNLTVVRNSPSDPIGFRLGVESMAVQVARIYPDGPAFRAGVREGDTVLGANWVAVKPGPTCDLNEAVALLKSMPKTFCLLIARRVKIESEADSKKDQRTEKSDVFLTSLSSASILPASDGMPITTIPNFTSSAPRCTSTASRGSSISYYHEATPSNSRKHDYNSDSATSCRASFSPDLEFGPDDDWSRISIGNRNSNELNLVKLPPIKFIATHTIVADSTFPEPTATIPTMAASTKMDRSQHVNNNDRSHKRLFTLF
jgi:hypothetical protein